jgi:hypothetical protein
LALRAVAMLDRKTRLNNPSAALSAGYFSDFTKPFDPVSARQQLLNPVTRDTTAKRCGRDDESESA